MLLGACTTEVFKLATRYVLFPFPAYKENGNGIIIGYLKLTAQNGSTFQPLAIALVCFMHEAVSLSMNDEIGNTEHRTQKIQAHHYKLLHGIQSCMPEAELI